MSPPGVGEGMTTLPGSATVVATDDAVSADVGGERVLLNVATGTYHGMNAVGSRVYDLVAAPRTVADVVAAVRAEFDVDAATADRDVREFLATLSDVGLVAVGPEDDDGVPGA
jgi:hypothetical protein